MSELPENVRENVRKDGLPKAPVQVTCVCGAINATVQVTVGDPPPPPEPVQCANCGRMIPLVEVPDDAATGG